MLKKISVITVICALCIVGMATPSYSLFARSAVDCDGAPEDWEDADVHKELESSVRVGCTGNAYPDGSFIAATCVSESQNKQDTGSCIN